MHTIVLNIANTNSAEGRLSVSLISFTGIVENLMYVGLEAGPPE